MEQLSWNKLVDKKLKTQKKLIYTLFVLLILSLSFIFYQATLFGDRLEAGLEKNKTDISILQGKDKQTQDNLILVAQAIGNLRTNLSRCEDVITDITDYLGDLSNNISIRSSRNWINNSYTYILDIEEFNYGFYFTDC